MTFSVPNGQSGNGTIVFTFTSTTSGAPPTLASVSPNSGGTAGGTLVTLTGTNLTGASSVKFGSTAAASFTVISATQITATSPAGTAGTVDVTVTTGNGTSATSASSQFTYVPAATYTVTYNGNGNTGGAVPTDASSPYSGGSTVTVLGNTGSLTRSGYTFNGWNTAASGSGTHYNPGSSFTIAGNATLYAQWQLAAPIAGPLSLSVAANSSANPVSLNLSGGAATSVAVSSSASHGTATASGANITYTPTAGYSGSDSFAYTASNAGGTSSPATVTVTVGQPTLALSPASLSGGTTGQAYSATVSAANGTAPYTYAITAGSLPTGLSLNSVGVISGTPSAGGTFNFTVTASDAYSATGFKAYALAMSTPTLALSPASLSGGTQGQAYGATVSAANGTGPYSYAITAGNLPAGLSLNATTGMISGTPSASGPFNFTVTATDAYGATGSQAYSLTVAAPSITAPDAPTIGTATAGDTQATVTFTAPASNGGSPITGYTVVSSPQGITATGSSSPITMTGLTNGTAYTFTVTATNSAGTSTASAPSNSATPKGSQSITFLNPGTQNFGSTPTLAASAPGGAVAFTSATTGVCTITSGGALTFVTAGSCTINANQTGNSAYLAAAQVTQTFTVGAVVPGAPTIGTATAGDTQASVTFTAPASNGGSAITVYTVVSNPGGNTATGTASPITVTGLTNGTAYTFTVTATNSAGTSAASAASNSATPKGSQTITFANPGAQSFGSTPTLTATAPGGAVTFTSATTGVCTITSGGALTFVTAGSCAIRADQAGNSQYLAAPQISQTFNVTAVMPSVPMNVLATAGNTQARVTFTVPADAGSSAIISYTVTAQPGGATVTAAASPIVVPGLTNGTAYTFTVTAASAAGMGAPSSPSNSVIPTGGVIQGPVPTHSGGIDSTGTATASTAALDPVQDPNCRLAGAQFAGDVPPGFTVSYGSFEFLATGCQHGVTISLTYPQALPLGVRFMKFGPPSFGAPNEWMDWTNKVQLSGDRKTATYSVLDNGAGDSDPRLGLIADPVIPAGLGAPPPGPAQAAAIPTLGEWGLALLAGLLGLFSLGALRKKSAARY